MNTVKWFLIITLVGFCLLTIYGYKQYKINQVSRNPGTLDIEGVKVDAICIARDSLAMRYDNGQPMVTAVDCNGDIVYWKGVL